jgi:pimeloyl-ACP methyl ester carboxylesterase
MDIAKIVISQIEQILVSNRENLDNYKFYPKNNSTIILEQKCFHVIINYGLFTPEQIINNETIYNDYLREKINELFDKVNKPEIQKTEKGTIVLVHGAWHTGPLLENTAKYLRKDGWAVYTPTIKGNKPGDNRANINLTQAIESIVEYIVGLDLNQVILVGHSYGGMIISGVVDKILNRIKRLVYWNAFVPLNGQSLVDMTPKSYSILFEILAKENNNAVFLPFPIWREAFINYGDFELATKAYNELNPHPYLTFTEKLEFKNFDQLVSLQIGKSYINGLADIALPQTFGWNPRLSERLGLFRYIDHPYDHEICFYDPKLLAECIIQAGRD